MTDRLPATMPCPKCGGMMHGPRYCTYLNDLTYRCSTCNYLKGVAPLDSRAAELDPKAEP